MSGWRVQGHFVGTGAWADGRWEEPVPCALTGVLRARRRAIGSERVRVVGPLGKIVVTGNGIIIYRFRGGEVTLEWEKWRNDE